MDSQSNSTPVPAISIAGVELVRDDAGRYNLNSLTRAAKAQGVEKDIRPNEWLALNSTAEMGEILITENPLVEPIVTTAGRYGGTFVHELLAVSYAGWISPSFQLKVNQTFLDVKSGRLALPDFSNPALAARAWADQVEARQLAERTKAEIGSRREATAMATASAATRKANQLQKLLDQTGTWASVKRMEKHYGKEFPWRPLKKASEEMGFPVRKVPDTNYDEVNTYHADVWMKVYGVTIPAAIAVEGGDE